MCSPQTGNGASVATEPSDVFQDVPRWHRWMKEAEEFKTSSQLLPPSTVALLPLAASLGCQQQSTFVATRCRFDSWWFFFIQLST